MSTLRRTLSLHDRYSWIHTMFWAIVAIVAGMVAALAAIVAGVDNGAVAIAVQLWSPLVLAVAFAAAAITGDPRIISSDRLVDRLCRTDEEEE